MIDGAIIKGFQSHKDTEISFDKGVNVITGASDAGKTSALRALLWVIRNRPTGDAIHSWNGDKYTYVSIETKEGIVSKDRGRGKTTYSIEHPNSRKKPMNFEAVKTDVPKEVQDVLGLSDINIQTQHQPYFLLSDSPGEVAKKLNEIVGLDIIDVLYKNINSKISSTKQSSANASADITNIKVQLEEFAYIEKAIEKIESLYKKANDLKTDQEKFDKTENLITDMKDKEEGILVHKSWLKVKGKYNIIKKAISNFEIELSKVEPVETLIEKMISNAGERRELDKSLTLLKERRNAFFTKNKICPACGQPIDKKIIERMLKQL